MSEEMSAVKTPVNRPGCVSVYAILLWITGGLGVIGGLCSLVGLSGIYEGGFGLAEIVLFGLSLLFAAIYIATGIGLWQMRKWGWALVVVYHSLAVIGGVLGILVSIWLVTQAAVAETLTYGCGVLIALAINGLILYWFIQNRELFNGGSGDQAPGPRKDNTAVTLVAVAGGLVLVFLLVCVVVVALLAVLGPQIGNVFSQITFTLDNPPPAITPWLW